VRIRAILFANVRSGNGRRWLDPIVQATAEFGIELVSTHLQLDADSIDRALELARTQDVKIVLVAGGDGTVGHVVGRVAGTDFTVGVIPAGTSNDFARSLLIPIDPRGALDVVIRGVATRVDIGVAGERTFVHAAVLGLSTQFVRADEALRSVLGRLSYPVAGVWSYLHRRRSHFTLKTTDQVHHFDAYEVAFVNAPVFAGPLEFEVAEAELDSRRLSVVVVERLGIRSLVRYVPAILTGHLGRLPGIQTLSIAWGEIDSVPPLEVTVDGETAGPTPMVLKVRPAALRVFVPQTFAERHHESRRRR